MEKEDIYGICVLENSLFGSSGLVAEEVDPLARSAKKCKRNSNGEPIIVPFLTFAVGNTSADLSHTY